MWNPCFRVSLFYLAGQETIHIGCITQPNRKSESQRVILVGSSNRNIIFLSPLCQSLSNAALTARKAATTCSPVLKLSMMDWDRRNRWSSVDIAFLKPD